MGFMMEKKLFWLQWIVLCILLLGAVVSSKHHGNLFPDLHFFLSLFELSLLGIFPISLSSLFVSLLMGVLEVLFDCSHILMGSLLLFAIVGHTT